MVDRRCWEEMPFVLDFRPLGPDFGIDEPFRELLGHAGDPFRVLVGHAGWKSAEERRKVDSNC